jgi:hypothetical protein
VRKTTPGEEVEIEIVRDGETKKHKVVIGDKTDAPHTPHVWHFKGDDDHKWIFRHHGDDFEDDDHIILKSDPGELHDIYIERFGGDHGYLGVHLDDLGEQLGEYFGVADGEGALITEVVEDSPAADAGLQAGDIIIQIGDDEVEDSRDVTNFMRDTEENDEIQVRILREKQEQTITVTVGERPDDFGWMGKGDFTIKAPRIKVLPRHLPGIEHKYLWHDDDAWEGEWEEEWENQEEALEELKEEMEDLKKELQRLKKELDEG